MLLSMQRCVAAVQSFKDEVYCFNSFSISLNPGSYMQSLPSGSAAGNCLLIKNIMGSCLLCGAAPTFGGTATHVLQSAHRKY
jgi:hypothetical protein